MKVTIEGSDKIVMQWVKALRQIKGITITSEDGTVLSKVKANPVSEEAPKEEVKTTSEEPVAEQGSDATEIKEVEEEVKTTSEEPVEEVKDKKKKGK